jgi:hypothetical protein
MIKIFIVKLDSAIIKPKETFRIFGSIGCGEDSFPLQIQ